MSAIRKALAVMVKDLRVVSRDRAYLISMLLFPLLVSFFSSSLGSGGGNGINLPVILSNQDSGAYGATVTQVLKSIDEINLTEASPSESVEENIADGTYLAAVLVPQDFSERINNYQPTEITVILDPTQANYGHIVTTIVEQISSSLAIQGEIRYGIRTVLAEMGVDAQANPSQTEAAQAQVEGVIFTQMSRMQSDPSVRVDKEVLSGRKVFTWNNIFELMLPALTSMFAFFITAAVATDLLREREAGSLRRLVSAPLSRGSLIGGKILAYTLIVIIQVVILFGFGVVLMDMPLGEAPFGLILTTLALGLVATTLGMMVAALSRSIDQAGSISLLLIFVLGFLSGSFSPQVAYYRGEGFFALLSRYTPQAQATIAYHSMLLQGGGLLDILPQIGYLLGLSLVFFLIAIWRFKFEQ
jgi:ABC-2 type transport system permease protein